jgi:hypothetical protein
MGQDFTEGRLYDAFLAMERIRQMRADFCAFLVRQHRTGCGDPTLPWKNCGRHEKMVWRFQARWHLERIKAAEAMIVALRDSLRGEMVRVKLFVEPMPPGAVPTYPTKRSELEPLLPPGAFPHMLKKWGKKCGNVEADDKCSCHGDTVCPKCALRADRQTQGYVDAIMKGMKRRKRK